MKLGDTLGGRDADRLKKKLDKAVEKEKEAKKQRELQARLRSGRTIRYNKEND